MNTVPDEVPAQIALCLQNGPAVLDAIECFIGAFEAAGRAAAEAARGRDAVFEELMARTGAWDLGEELGVIGDRIATCLGGTGGVLEADEAAGYMAVVAGWHTIS